MGEEAERASGQEAKIRSQAQKQTWASGSTVAWLEPHELPGIDWPERSLGDDFFYQSDQITLAAVEARWG